MRDKLSVERIRNRILTLTSGFEKLSIVIEHKHNHSINCTHYFVKISNEYSAKSLSYEMKGNCLSYVAQSGAKANGTTLKIPLLNF